MSLRRQGLIVVLVLVAVTGVGAVVVSQLLQPQLESSSYVHITASELHSMLARKDFVLVNTHIPYEGEIEGTDLFIPYNEIQNRLDKLPEDRNVKIVVYCMSDRMSNIAAKELAQLGYTNVLNLEGGMISWRENGYPIVHR